MSLSSGVDEPENGPATRKKLSAKDLSIDLTDDLDIGSADTSYSPSKKDPFHPKVSSNNDFQETEETHKVCNGEEDQSEKKSSVGSKNGFDVISERTEPEGETADALEMRVDVASPGTLPPGEIALLALLEEANRQLEADTRSLHSFSPQTQRKELAEGEAHLGHSRHGSLSSEISCFSASSVNSNPPMEEVPVDLWSTWKSIVDDWENKSRRKSYNLRELVRKGIPTHFRGIVWPMLCEAHVSDDKLKYSEYMRMTSPSEKSIRRDIARTYPDHNYFKDRNSLGQETLFNVMKAYSLHDREVGYCQGSGFIVGLLLMQMPEEDAFAVFVRIMQGLRLRELYTPNMAEIGLCMFQLESIIQEHIPDLYNHFQSQGLYISMFAAPWFLTLLTASTPLPIACRVFDIFLLEGLEIIFRMGFAVLQILSQELQTQDMEGMIKILQKDLPIRLENEAERLFSTAFQLKFNPRKMKKLEKEYNALKTKEDEEQTEIRKLRSENRLLRQRIDNLEAETATLADRLIQDQVKYAQQSEEIYSLRRAVSYTRRMSCEPIAAVATGRPLEIDKDGLISGFDEDMNGGTVEDLQKTVADMVNQEIKAKAVIQDLRTRIQELEKANQQSSSEPSIDIQNLQDQLIASKMREAEASLSAKELEQKVSDLEKYWQKHMESVNSPDVKGKLGRSRLQEVNDELMSAKIREASATVEMTDLKQKFMELETKNHICERQIKRMEAETERLNGFILEHETKEKELENQIKENARQISDTEAKRKEEEILLRIKEAEHSQVLAEMRQRIAELEIQNQELKISAQLHGRGSNGDNQELENKIADLQEELQMLQLRMSQKVMASSLLGSLSIESDSDIDQDEIDSNRLRLTDSMGPQIASEAFGISTPKNSVHQEPDIDNGDVAAENCNLNDGSALGIKGWKLQLNSGSVDFDRTPTNDANNLHYFASLADRSFNENVHDGKASEDLGSNGDVASLGS